MRSPADLWSAVWPHFINLCSVLGVCSISPQHSRLVHIRVCCTKMSSFVRFSRLSSFPSQSLSWSKHTQPVPAHRGYSKPGAEERAEYAQCELDWPCFVPTGLQHQPHGMDKRTGMSPWTQLCSAEAASSLCSQKPEGAERASCFQTLHEEGSNPGPLIYCSPEVWVTRSPGSVRLLLLGVTTPASSATTQHHVLGKGAHPGCFPCNHMPGRGEKGDKSQ